MILPHRHGAARPAGVAAGLACIGLVVLAAQHAPISATAVGERAAVYFGAAAAAFAAYVLAAAPSVGSGPTRRRPTFSSPN